jgi:hypothetical protein
VGPAWGRRRRFPTARAEGATWGAGGPTGGGWAARLAGPPWGPQREGERGGGRLGRKGRRGGKRKEKDFPFSLNLDEWFHNFNQSK